MSSDEDSVILRFLLLCFQQNFALCDNSAKDVYQQNINSLNLIKCQDTPLSRDDGIKFNRFILSLYEEFKGRFYQVKDQDEIKIYKMNIEDIKIRIPIKYDPIQSSLWKNKYFSALQERQIDICRFRAIKLVS